MDEITQLPLITLDNPIGDMRHNVPYVAQLIAEGNVAYNHGGVAVVLRDGALRAINKAELPLLMVAVADFQKMVGDPPRPKATLPPPTFIGALNELLPTYLPKIEGFAPHPVWKDGELLQSGWYDGLLVACDDVEVEAWNDPTDAMDWILDDWLADFPFKSEVDEVNAIAMACTMLVSPTHLAGEEGPPAFNISASRHNTGKSYLTMMIMEAITGEATGLTTWPETREEMVKVLTTLVLSGRPYIIFDNVLRGWRIGDPRLEQFVTASKYSGRLLGGNKEINAPSNAVVVVTGNQTEVTQDMRSRTLNIRLVPDPAANLAQRTYKHENMRAFTQANRGKILGALDAILSAEGECETAGRFPAWNQIVARPIITVSQVDLTAEWKDVGEEGEQTEFEDQMPGIAQKLHERPTPEKVAGINGNWFTAAELVREYTEFGHHMLGITTTQKLSACLRREADILHGCFVIRVDKRNLGARTDYKKKLVFKAEKVRQEANAQG